MVFEAILTGWESGQRLQCFYGNLMANTFSKIEIYTICESQPYSPSLKDAAWLHVEDAQLNFLIFDTFVCIQTQSFLTALPTRQDGVENYDKA